MWWRVNLVVVAHSSSETSASGATFGGVFGMSGAPAADGGGTSASATASSRFPTPMSTESAPSADPEVPPVVPEHFEASKDRPELELEGSFPPRHESMKSDVEVSIPVCRLGVGGNLAVVFQETDNEVAHHNIRAQGRTQVMKIVGHTLGLGLPPYGPDGLGATGALKSDHVHLISHHKTDNARFLVH
jgi:hypothetical protein